MAGRKRRIKLNHIAKMEGHSDFVAEIINGRVTEAKMMTLEGARQIEGILIGRNYYEAIVVTGRICGVCPIVHFITSAQALEDALDIKVSEQTIIFRELLECCQHVYSHALHYFFLSLPDFFDINNDIKFMKEHPKETEAAIHVRDYTVKLAEIIGGRAVMPLTVQVGGFKKLPEIKVLKEFLTDYDKVIEDAQLLLKMAKKIKLPKLNRKTENISLHYKKYPNTLGEVHSSDNGVYDLKTFYNEIKELHEPRMFVKRTHHLGKPYLAGALGRVNNSYEKLNPLAKKAWDSFNINLPSYNSFHNIIAQGVEIVHYLEEIKNIIEGISKIDHKNLTVDYKLKAGIGLAGVEAPRGLLFHTYSLNNKGIITNCNIISPTAQFLANLEADMFEFLPDVAKLSLHDRRIKIRSLIRAYDPCISCATH